MRYLLYLSLYSATFLCGCSGCEKFCDPSPVPARQVRWSATPLDNSGASPTPTTSLSISRQAFGIRLACPTDFNPADTVGADLGCGFQFYADTPIVSIRIISLLDFDFEHLGISEVTDFFQCRIIGGGLPFSPPGTDPVGSSHTRYAEAQEAVSLLNRTDHPEVQTDLLLTKPPAMPITAWLVVELVRRDGSIVRRELPPVQLF